MKTLGFWFFRCNIVESMCPPIQKQQSETVTHIELQYVLGIPLAANEQLAISRERNATSLHCIENQCAMKDSQKLAHLLLWCGPAYCWAAFLSPKPATTTTNSQFGSTFSIPNIHGFRILYTNMILTLSQKETRTNKDNIASKTATPTTPTV